jgi:hypothetical protein
MPFVPDDFDVPPELDLGWCHLRPLTAADNADDVAAWHASIDHIRATPGFAERRWPIEYRIVTKVNSRFIPAGRVRRTLAGGCLKTVLSNRLTYWTGSDKSSWRSVMYADEATSIVGRPSRFSARSIRRWTLGR